MHLEHWERLLAPDWPRKIATPSGPATPLLSTVAIRPYLPVRTHVSAFLSEVVAQTLDGSPETLLGVTDRRATWLVANAKVMERPPWPGGDARNGHLTCRDEPESLLLEPKNSTVAPILHSEGI